MTREHALQCACVSWFRLQYPRYKDLLFAIPNGGLRNQRVAAQIKSEGGMRGVHDLFFMYNNGDFPGMWIEMKTPEGRMSKEQVKFKKNATIQGYKTAQPRSIEQFIEEINKYLKVKF